MIIQRRTLGLLAGSSLIATAFPFVAFADDDDESGHNDAPEGGREAHVKSKKHHSGPITAQFLKYDWHIDFKSNKVAEDDWKDDFPEHGQASILIDYKGNWQFMGSFPAQPLKRKCRVTVGVALKSSLGQIIAFTKTLTLDHDGGSWSKNGHDQIVEDLWKDVVKGHDWAWSAHFRQEKPKEQQIVEQSQPSHSNGGGGESTADQVGDDLGKSLLGPIGWFF